jgi:multidrug resistance efflux pump
MNETTTRTAAAEAHPNGARPALSDRVRSLRLSDAQEEAGGRRSSWLPWTLCALLCLVIGYLVLDAMAPIDEATLKQAVDERIALLVKGKPGARFSAHGDVLPASASASTSSSSEDEVVLDSKGYVTPVHTIQVSPQVTGKIVELTFDEGKNVKAGDVLAILEKTEYQSYHDNAVAKAAAAEARWQLLWKYRQDEIKQAEADLEDSRSQMIQLKAKADRTEQLWRQRSASQEDYEQAYFAYVSRKSVTTRLDLAYKLLVEGPRDSQIAAAKADHEQCKADLIKAKWQLDNCVVVAPVTGTILAKRAEVGNLTNPAAFTTGGLPAGICDLADLSDLEVDLSISELDIAKVFKGQACKVRAEAYPGRPYGGFVSRVMPTADRAKAAVSVRVKITMDPEEAGRYLRPDMGARVSFYNKKG